MKQQYTITEYQSVIADKIVPNYTTVSKDVFDALKSMILTSNASLDFIQLIAQKGVGEVIKARNYVGLIITKSGTVIEILPKIAKNQNNIKVREILLKMLKTLKGDVPFKHMQNANLNIARLPLLEIFIRMFIIEALDLVRHGLKGSYQVVQSNESLFKGKLKVNEHILLNSAHKERCFVEYDNFEMNRPENCIIKTTLLFLIRITSNLRNKTDLNKLLLMFSEIDESVNIENDFQRITNQRDMKDYENIMRWCRVFLQRKSFSPFVGENIAVSLLFPMEKLFESYIASFFQRYSVKNNIEIKVQDKTFYIFDDPTCFRIIPDIVLNQKSTKLCVVCDTKWKLLSQSLKNYGISQSDMYQMYVYQKKYEAQKIYVIYPKSDDLLTDKQIEFKSTDGIDIQVCFIDLMNDIEDEVNRLFEYIFQ